MCNGSSHTKNTCTQTHTHTMHRGLGNQTMDLGTGENWEGRDTIGLSRKGNTKGKGVAYQPASCYITNPGVPTAHHSQLFLMILWNGWWLGHSWI